VVHLVDEEAGRRLEQQAGDGRRRAEAEAALRGVIVHRVEDPEVDDVGQDRQDQPEQELEGGRRGGGEGEDRQGHRRR